MNNSTNDVLEQGIQEVTRLTARITTLAEQEEAFRGTAKSLKLLNDRLQAIRVELEKLDSVQERRKWMALWISLGSLALIQAIGLILIIVKL